MNTTPTPAPTMCRGRALEWGRRTYVMGIVNATPDSFYAGSRRAGADDALAAAAAMIESGADFIDIGGESTRPGAEAVPLDEEIRRTVPVVSAVRAAFPHALISIDTYKSAVAAASIEAGADIINDISALGFDPDMARIAAAARAPVCLMHIQGTPRNMQKDPRYERGVITEIIEFLQRQIDVAVNAGISLENIWIDPGIGFGKTVDHNLEILRRLSEFKSLGRPLLVGASRKSFIGKTLGLPDEADRLEGSLAVAALAAAAAADIIRAHDVPETIRAVRMADAVAGR